MHYDWKIECLEVENAYTQSWMAYLLFHNLRFPRHDLAAQVGSRVEMAYWADVPTVLVEVQRFRSASSVSADSLLYHFGMEGSQPYDFCKPLPGVSPSQPSSCDAQETILFASSLLGLQREVSGIVVVFPLLRGAKTCLWPFSPYFRQGACRTVPAVPDLLASP